MAYFYDNENDAISEWNGGHAITIFIQWNRQVELRRQMAKEKFN